MSMRGRPYANRYHETIVTSRRQMRVVIRYVLDNHAKHTRQVGREAAPIDRYSSAVCTELVCEGQSSLA